MEKCNTILKYKGKAKEKVKSGVKPDPSNPFISRERESKNK